MDVMEFEGRTIDEAINKACKSLGVPREKLNIDILSEGTSGFLGLGAKKAQIRAGLLNIDLSMDAPFPPREPKAAVRPPQPPTRPPEIRQASREERKPTPAPAEPRPAPVVAESSGNDDASAQKAKGILEGLLMRMQIEAPVEVKETEEAIILNIQGDGSGLLIGKRGQNLDALQYIVNKAVHHTANGHKMIVIDTEAYRKRREEALITLAMRIGEKVKKTKKPVTVGHMNAHDRRIIHLAIQNDTTLTTKSRGEGEYRNILILPVRRGPEDADA
ncbi:MAG: Jag N-terminal domain-containing protein [Deltaproteobacteria bacterium]|nr:Jag N-terminal domain-containing protein [Deltaproteobacteria bacterium]